MRRIKTSDLYEVACFKLLGARVIKFHGTRKHKVYSMEVPTASYILEKLIRPIWRGLRDERIELKNNSIAFTSRNTLKRAGVGSKTITKKDVKEAIEFLTKWENRNGRVIKS